MNHPLRILCCSSSLEGGGSERQMLQLVRGLDRSQFQPSLYLVYPKGSLLADIPADVSTRAFWSDRTFPRWNWPGRIRQQQIVHLTEVLQRDSINVCYDRLFHVTLINGPASKRAQVGRVSTIVSPPEQDLPRSEKRWVWLKRMQLAHAYSTADRLIAVSHDTAESAARYYRIPLSKIEVILSPVDLSRIDVLSECPWPGIAIDKGRKNILAVGRQSEEKGHRYLIEAMAIALKASEWKLDLHLVGDGPLRGSLEQQADQLKIRQHVHFHGYSDNPYSIMAKCDLFCLPSQYEGMPNVILEAMACRIPVLATDCTESLHDLLSPPQRGVIVPTANPQALANAILDRFKNPKHWERKIEPSRTHIERFHDLSRWLIHMQNLFSEVAASRQIK